MNYSEVKALLEAGFNADEIRQMLNPQNPQDNTQPDPEPTPEPDSEPTPEPDPEPTPEPSPAPELDNRFNQLNETMTKILKAIQGNNLQNNSVKSIDADINTQVDKIMGSLIRPEHEKKEG